MLQVGRIVVSGVVVAVLAGCRFVGGPGGGSSVESDGARFEVDGVANDPVGEKVVAASLDSPLGVLTVETYRSSLGPCADLVHPDGEREANCLPTSGIDPDRPVTGTPDGSIEVINGPSLNLGLGGPGEGVGWLHWGLAHPAVARVVVQEAGGDGAGDEFEVVNAPNVPGLAVYVVWTAEGVGDHQLAAYDADGCLLEVDPFSPTDPFGEEPGGAAALTC